MKYSELTRWGSDVLNQAGVETYRLDAEVLLCSALEISRVQLIGGSENEVPPDAESHFRDFISRRSNFEPVSYITGTKEFYEREFIVSPAVLIPRPETELLVERALACLEEQSDRDVFFVDVGTGSGAILLAVLSEVKQKGWLNRITAFGFDLSVEALEIARRNASKLGLGDRAVFLESDLLQGLTKLQLPPNQFLLCVANLPYIPEDEVLPPDVENFEPQVALRGGKDGLEMIFRLLEQVLREKPFQQGLLLLELGQGQSVEVESRLLELGLGDFRFISDLQGIKRVLEIKFGQ